MIVSPAALVGAVVYAQLVAPLPRLPRLPLPTAAPGVARAAAHQNRVAAGTRDGGVVTLALDVVESAWKPEGVDDPEVPILAFAERGRGPLVPGPLVRVTLGT